MSENRNLQVQQKRTVADLINSDKMRLEIAKVLPKHLTPERMTRVAMTAIMRNADLMQCTPESLTNSMMILSQAGLEPDGRLAHLIPYWNSKKNCYECQVIFDYKGLVTLIRRNGAETVYAEKVCEFDQFDAWVEDGVKKLTHRINWKKPRGTAYLYYAVIVQGGTLDWEVMPLDEVEDIRKRSRAGDKGPWVTDFDEMAKKSPLRRISKRCDLLPEIAEAINADDDTPPPFGQVTTARPIFDMPKALPKPEPEAAAPAPEVQPDPEPDPEPPVEEEAPTPVPSRAGVTGNGQPNYLKGVRDLAKMSKVKEGSLLSYWASEGVTDGSQTSLEEVQMTTPDVMRITFEQWKDLAPLIAAQAKGGGK